jgi:hypothetical protein
LFDDTLDLLVWRVVIDAMDNDEITTVGKISSSEVGQLFRLINGVSDAPMRKSGETPPRSELFLHNGATSHRASL